MTQNTRTFWATFMGVGIPVVISAAGLLWAMSAWVAVQQGRLSQVEQRVSNLEINGKNNHDILIEIRNDVKWITGGERRPAERTPR